VSLMPKTALRETSSRELRVDAGGTGLSGSDLCSWDMSRLRPDCGRTSKFVGYD
jgi:hypothetical protein